MKHVKLWRIGIVASATFLAMVFAAGMAFADSGQRAERGVPAPGTTAPGEVSPPPSLGELVQTAKTNVAGRLAAPVSAMTLESATPVDWPDSSLGCPESGSMHLPVITPGFLIVISHEGTRYEYHSDMEGPPFFCENGG